MEKVQLSDRRAPPQGKISFEEFLAWADEDAHAEWEDGEVVVLWPASKRHQDINVWLTMILGVYVDQSALGWLTSAPFLIQLRTAGQAREPDLLFLKTENLNRLHDTYLEGPADLVVEIASPESVGQDRGRKFVEYEGEGIPEYWLIDPVRRQAEFYRLGEDQRYRPSLPDEGGVYRNLSVGGFWLKVDRLWPDSLPDSLATLRQLGVLEG